MEQGPMYNAINFTINYESLENTTVSGMSVKAYLCPSEVHPQAKPEDFGQLGVNSYAVNMGDWFIWGGFGGQENRGVFGPNRSRKLADFTDGTSSTLLASQVKTYQAQVRDCSLSQINNPNVIPPPFGSPTAVAPEYNGSCAFKTSEGGKAPATLS
jgi:hypothetical protein